MLIWKEFLIFTLFLFCMAIQIAADEADSDFLNKLSPEVIAAMEGNQKTINSIQTLQAVITKNSTHDYGEKGSRQLLEKLKLWYDGNNTRQNVLESRFTGKDIEPLSLGQVEGGGQSYFRPPPVGDVEIYTSKSYIYYYPPTEYVGVVPSEKDKSEILRANNILNYQSVIGRNLKEKILQSASLGYYFTATSEKINEDNCVLLSCDYSDVQMALKIWVVPSKGYCIKKLQSIYQEKVADEYTTTLKKYPPNIWWFDTVKIRESPQGDVITGSEISVNSLIFNEPLDPDIFTVWGIDVTANTKVHDQIQGTTYTLAVDKTEITQANADQENIVADTTDSSNKAVKIGLGITTLIIVIILVVIIKSKTRFPRGI
jgi:hypothetical protein